MNPKLIICSLFLFSIINVSLFGQNNLNAPEIEAKKALISMGFYFNPQQSLNTNGVSFTGGFHINDYIIYGGYTKGIMGGNFCYEDGSADLQSFYINTGQEKMGKYVLKFGAAKKVFRFFWIYTDLGWAKVRYKRLYETINGAEWLLCDYKTFSGIQIETGIIIPIYKFFGVNIGYNTVNFKEYDFTYGLSAKFFFPDI